MNTPNIFAFTQAQPALVAIVRDRVFPLMIPQHSFEGAARMPCMVFTTINVNGYENYCGSEDLRVQTLQLDFYAPDYDDMLHLAEVGHRVLRDYRGLMGETSVKHTRFETRRDGVEPDPGLFRRSEDWTLWYLET